MSKRTSRTVSVVLAVAVSTAAALATSSVPAAAAPYPGSASIQFPSLEPGVYSSEFKAANANGDSVSEVIVGDLSRGEYIRTFAMLWPVDGRASELTLLPGDVGGSPTGINNARTVVGTSTSPGAGIQGHAVRWSSPSTPSELLPLPGDTAATPAAISDNGTAVGSSRGAASVHAVAWPVSGAPVALPPLPGDTESVAVAVNSSGAAVGYSYPAGGIGSERAVVWGPDGTVTALAAPAGYVTSSATRITDSGIIIGTGRPGAPTGADHALVWNAAGAVADLGAGSRARAVNNGGTVVGNLGGQAARWSADGTPLPLAPSTLTSVATGINDQGAIVGYTSDPPPARAQFYAQRWEPDGSVTALPEWASVYPYSTAYFITDSGIVVGELMLRGLAGYGRPEVLRWHP
ncbi:hypothetical protein [Kitasatospora purpeofusca]|uniref:hypothetical protein n=1 Tax=Kitasatospora purpeofusca TaxID=67352 RepID=UPI0035D9CD43